MLGHEAVGRVVEVGARVTTFKEVLSTSWLTIGLVADDWIGGWRVYHIDYKQDRVIRAIETWQDW